MKTRPIGIFDSGVGGLTVVKQIFKRLPNEEIVYLGDTARVPYGTKSPETIKKYSVENADFLMRFKVKLIVVACNTASSTSLDALREKFSIPIVGVIKPGAEKAVQVTRNNRVGIIGTYTTVKSKAYEKELRHFSRDVEAVSKACPLFVPLVEEGWLKEGVTFDIVKKYLKPLMAKKIDTLILGCTHYPLLKPVISKVMGRHVKIVDSASSVADEVHNILMALGKLSGQKKPKHKFFATDAVEHFVRVGEKFLGTKIKGARKADYV
ncbi:MAG: glutamate racemase [Candidatus Omnitrophica bacterium CG_4_9_14_0_2_um_filter_42_8]|nr:MAG: glutamate racemase [Candidatus Omnitrophica bacterium CG22_combo_CG10-13_8_21_14_all_43_16]PJC48478.1 MAG: glutamate racemase [Candidatus Omnitrophica bacterium CG_4_9_14_0_2_um_filter_42_8]